MYRLSTWSWAFMALVVVISTLSPEATGSSFSDDFLDYVKSIEAAITADAGNLETSGEHSTGTSIDTELPATGDGTSSVTNVSTTTTDVTIAAALPTAGSEVNGSAVGRETNEIDFNGTSKEVHSETVTTAAKGDSEGLKADNVQGTIPPTSHENEGTSDFDEAGAPKTSAEDSIIPAINGNSEVKPDSAEHTEPGNGPEDANRESTPSTVVPDAPSDTDSKTSDDLNDLPTNIETATLGGSQNAAVETATAPPSFDTVTVTEATTTTNTTESNTSSTTSAPATFGNATVTEATTSTTEGTTGSTTTESTTSSTTEATTTSSTTESTTTSTTEATTTTSTTEETTTSTTESTTTTTTTEPTTTTTTTTTMAPKIPPTALILPRRQTIQHPNSVTVLDASTSFVPHGGAIVEYTWKLLRFPHGYTFTTRTFHVNDTDFSKTLKLERLLAGEYTFKLTVRASNGLSSSTTAEITVLPDRRPVVVVQKDITVHLPQKSITLDGSGSWDDKRIVRYEWTPVGKINCAIDLEYVHTPFLRLSNLREGNYEFKLTVWDTSNQNSAATVRVCVKPEVIKPTANAGRNRTVTLPYQNWLVLDASDSTAQAGSEIVKYVWTQVSAGPNNAFISQRLGDPKANVTGLVEGEYTFQVQVEDEREEIATSSLTVTVVKDSETIVPAAPSLPSGEYWFTGSTTIWLILAGMFVFGCALLCYAILGKTCAETFCCCMV